ncbi:Thioesterase/thiol ester dehydrase-isomerase [Hortaea werneckii]|nr:Thioesterase/thiol ester dehydrase-isomerase [Hortaea werneckii]KAI7668715.1 Thioesterase/thiol ester dehydrase-isomerase [Hortaea werneckii]
MSESYHSVVLPLAQEPWLLDTYLNSSGHIRLGTIFMDLDALSGVIAYKHTGDSVTTVTAAFDRITINHPLHEIVDLELSGQVTYASGRSSMEISLQVAKAPKTGEEVRPEDVLLTCSCTMVSLDPGTKKPVNIAPVRTDTDAEKQVYAQGEKNSKHRKDLAQRSLLKTAPNDEESDLIHALWQQQLKIFGGFLLKQTFELAFCCAASFAHVRPTFVSLDPSTFQNPVPVGSVLYLTATVVYTDPPLVAGQTGGIAPEETRDDNSQTRVQIRVDSKVRDVEHGETKPTGQFNYTFTVDKNVKVLPRTYTELMMYVDARRRARRVIETVKQGEADDGSQDRVTE